MWILIIVLWTSSDYVSTPMINVSSIEFSSRDACIDAGKKLALPEYGEMRLNKFYKKLQCVKK
ncbi:hypothetical protein phiPLPE_12 [Iodobacter phage PhiPLPE]|uniref:Uncharacterized protein n=1 Tax=Iodobacter phage PhiPLPE TaxID=551895 RepID=B5AX31_9CAUD|nr:hypothetical protein phiPLPE_12 [Iodobacter phage PhiPLPE]ACG60334.1 hypothetical protein phiPLPE_12 [Iodobacter phage PhiPLPE]